MTLRFETVRTEMAKTSGITSGTYVRGLVILYASIALWRLATHTVFEKVTNF